MASLPRQKYIWRCPTISNRNFLGLIASESFISRSYNPTPLKPPFLNSESIWSPVLGFKISSMATSGRQVILFFKSLNSIPNAKRHQLPQSRVIRIILKFADFLNYLEANECPYFWRIVFSWILMVLGRGRLDQWLGQWTSKGEISADWIQLLPP